MTTAESNRTATDRNAARVNPHSAPPPPGVEPHPDEHRRHAGYGNGTSPTPPPGVPESRSLPQLLKELRDEGIDLMRNEVALAKAEMVEKARIYGRNSAKAASGSIVLTIGVIYLVAGLITATYFILWELGMSNVWAGFVSLFGVALLVTLIGWGMMNSAKKKITNESPYPDATARSMKENNEWLEHKVR